MLAQHAFILQVDRSRVRINHAETGSYNRVRVQFSGTFQGAVWFQTSVIHFRQQVLAPDKASKHCETAHTMMLSLANFTFGIMSRSSLPLNMLCVMTSKEFSFGLI
ncbi:hypothetical protein XENORESO_002623 [Xenotaenia resolanae]|uniref:Uncharacterized protein n=1 Tax=Xenotaenia resolanae TaxID=208358 RepID=A0ABV0VUH6_9TELE